MNRSRAAGLWLAVATAFISGIAIFLNSYGVKAVGDAALYTTAKNLVAGAVLLVVVGVAAARRPGVVTRPATASSWIGLVVVAVIGGSVPFLLFFEGLSRTASPVQAAFLQKTLVLWVALLAVPILRERAGGWHWAAIGLLLVGQAAATGRVTGPLHMSWGSGELMVLAATLMWSAEVVVAKKLLGEISSWTLGLVRMVLGSALLVAWAFVRGDAGRLLQLNAEQSRWVLLTGVLLASYVACWFAALQRAPAVDVTAVLVAGAVVTAALSAIVNGTRLQPQLGGLGLIVAGSVLVAWRLRAAPEGQLAT